MVKFDRFLVHVSVGLLSFSLYAGRAFDSHHLLWIPAHFGSSAAHFVDFQFRWKLGDTSLMVGMMRVFGLL